MNVTHSTYKVFTPTTQARINFVSRPGLDKTLSDALQTPGKQVIIYGESGSGKSTLLVNGLEAMGISHITSRCSGNSKYESILLDAFDQLDPFFTDSTSSSDQQSSGATLEAQFQALKMQISASQTKVESQQQKRALPPQLTPQRLGTFMGARNLCWILEDFHKVSVNEKGNLAQTLKIFSDLAAEFEGLRIIALGATDTAREVVQYDPEMKNRVAEIRVPLMAEKELGDIIANGSTLLNIDMKKLSSDIVGFSAGLASVTHHLALNACLHAEVMSTRAIRIHLTDNNMKAAIGRYIDESSDTLKALFDAALVRQRERRYDNTRLLLEALATGPTEGMSHAEIRTHIRKQHADYPAGNVTTYLNKLQQLDRGAVVKQAANGKFRFKDPILHSYARAIFKVGNTPRQEATGFQIYISNTLTERFNEQFGEDESWVNLMSHQATSSPSRPRKHRENS